MLISTNPAQPMHFTPPKNHRFHFLDALRGIAAMFVVAFHFPPAMASSFVANGPLAVDFFFCLSGFVIAFSYEHRLAENLSFTDFTVARLIRLYPIYLFGTLFGLLIASLVQHLVSNSPESLLSSLSLFIMALFLWPARLSAFNMTDNYPLDGPAWSLFYEMFANLAYALLVRLRIATTPILLCMVGGSLALLLNAVGGGKGLDLGPKQTDFGLGFARVTFSFFLGVLICRFHHHRARNTDASRLQRLAPITITLILIWILNSPLSWMRTDGFRLFAISLCFPAMVYFGALAQIPRRLMCLSTIFGELSYPLYLLHEPFVSLMKGRHIKEFSLTHPVLAHLSSLWIIAIFAYLAWWAGEHIDLPIRRALTQRYNVYQDSKRGAIAYLAAKPEAKTSQQDEV